MKTIALTTREIYWAKFLCSQWIEKPQFGPGSPPRRIIPKILGKLGMAKRCKRQSAAPTAPPEPAKKKKRTERIFRDYE